MAAAASYLTVSFLSSKAGVIAFNDAGSPLFAIANTAAARTAGFLSEHALALGGRLKTGQRWTLQKRPTKPSQDKSIYTCASPIIHPVSSHAAMRS